MNKKSKNLIIGSFISLALVVAIPTVIVIPLQFSKKQDNSAKLNKKLINSYKNIFTKESEQNINELFFQILV